MEYVVIRSFTDKATQQHYAVGDRYPHRGFANKERVEELSTVNNRRGVILIEAKSEKKAGKPSKKPVEAPVEAEVETTAEVSEEAVEPKPERKKRTKK